MYEDEEYRLYLVDPHKQTFIDLQYFVKKLKATGNEALILMEANQAEAQTYQQQTYNIKLVMKKGFHLDGTIDGSLQTFMQNCGLTNILRQMHEGIVPNTHARGSVQIDSPFLTSGLVENVLDVGLLNRSVLESDHSGMFVDLIIKGIFGQHPDKVAPHKFRNLKLYDPHLTEDNPLYAIEREEKIEMEIKAHENRRNTQGSFRKLGRQIRGHVKPNSTKKSSLVRLTVPDTRREGLCRHNIG
jgi:hypothetical protein